MDSGWWGKPVHYVFREGEKGSDVLDSSMKAVTPYRRSAKEGAQDIFSALYRPAFRLDRGHVYGRNADTSKSVRFAYKDVRSSSTDDGL